MITYDVLIVDDELGMRLGAEKSLRKFIYRPENFDDEVNLKIHQAEDGASAIELLENESIDILLLDYKLPDSNGLEILSRAMEIKPGILTIMITAYASLEVAISATKKGVFDFLAKPFTPDELRATIRKAAEKIYLNAKARELEKDKKRIRFQFISILAHELKSPLNAVENYLYLMNDRIAGDEIKAYDSMVKRSLVRMDGMRKLISDILDLTGIESGQKKRELRMINFSELAGEMIEEYKLEAVKRNITLNYSADDDIRLLSDRGELEMIVNNLVSNAVKYNRENGNVRFSISGDAGEIKIVCEDTGIGVSPEGLKNLFREFYRIKSAETEDVLGTGLGLAILKKTVELYNGEIKVESEVGKGTRFEILIPVAEPGL